MNDGPGVTVAQTDENCLLDAGPFRLSFTWRGDRWAHQLLLGGRAIASSFEWDESLTDATRVVSPAYQQMHVHEEADGPRVLTVGQWGRHHFSGVFAVHGGREQGGTLDIDVAVRTRADLHVLASTYVVHRTSSDLLEANTERIAWSVADTDTGLDRLVIEPAETPFGPGSIALGEAGRREARVQAGAVVDPRSASHRLKYRWRWS